VIEVRQAASGGAELDAARALRIDVFVGEQGVSVDEELDGRDDEATHLVAVDADHVVGTCRLLGAAPRVRLGRLAVAASARRRGVASALLAHAEQWAREQGADEIVLAAQTTALPLYAQAGYIARGARFMEAGIEHVMMHKLLV
jgi:predicted GNAT family N-acyltransferase